MAVLQGFHEISLAAPAGKAVMIITDSATRFNKATATEPAIIHTCACSSPSVHSAVQPL